MLANASSKLLLACKHSENREDKGFREQRRKIKDSESREDKGFGEQSSAEELVMGESGRTRL
jgi:hypothetical protein